MMLCLQALKYMMEKTPHMFEGWLAAVKQGLQYD